MLRRALRVGPATATDAIDSETWSAAAPAATNFWGESRPRPSRAHAWWARRPLPAVPRRGRAFAAVMLVGGLGAGWIATSHVGGDRRPVAVSRSHDTTASAPATAAPVAAEAAPARSLRTLVPAGAKCGYGPRSASEAHCSIGTVEVDYQLLAGRALRAAYLAGLGEPSISMSSPSRKSATPRCATGGEEERSWSRPAAPGRAVGRYACRIEQGRATMWWTVVDRGLLAHVTAAGSGNDLSSLFAWWESHAER